MNALYLVRHGQAKSKQENPGRPLSDTGIAQAQETAELLKMRNVVLGAIWHSGKARAQQTAEILVAAVDCSFPPIFCEGLKPNDPVQFIADEVETGQEPLMIVGHLPFLSKLVGCLTTGRDEEVVSFGEAELVVLERDEGGRWRVKSQ